MRADHESLLLSRLVDQYPQRYSFLGARRRLDGWIASTSVYSLILGSE
jgi:hypothetical protein